MDIIPSETVLIDSIRPNDWNPNHMKEPVFEFLKKNIQKKGFYQPVIVIKDPESEGYIIIDGEHRWKAAKENGYTEIEVKVLDLSLPLAKAETINANRIKGTFDPVELGSLLTDIISDPTITDPITDICVIPDFEIELLTDISDEIGDEKDSREEIKKVQRNFQIMLKFENKQDLEEVRRLLAALLEKDPGVSMNGTIVKKALELALTEA